MALDTNSPTLFFNPPHTLGSFLSYPRGVGPHVLALLDTAAATRLGLAALAGADVDGELAWSWGVMYDFCVLANLASRSSYRVTMDDYVSAMTSVAYRLVHMRFEGTCKNEAVRLGLLAFSASIFLQWRQLGLGYAHLASSYRRCLLSLDPAAVDARFWLWLVMLGSVSLFGQDDLDWVGPLLVMKMEECNVRSWAEMQHVLSSVMWVGSVHDGPGRAMFKSLGVY